MKKQKSNYSRDAIHILWLFMIALVATWMFNTFWHKYPTLAKEQEMRCDYDGCIVIDKPQPFSWYNTGE